MKSYTKHRWFALFAFFLFELIHNTDKLLIGPLTTPIMETFHINEAQMGAASTAALLVGTALFPLWGYLYDKFARPKLLALASFIWGLTTMLNSRAPSYPLFMATRASTGIDDSSYSGLESMVSDFFEPKLRSKVYGLLLIAPSIGYLLAMVLAMFLAGSIGWRNLYFITGSVGIIVAVLIFFGVKDPPRGSSEPEMQALEKVVPQKFSWHTVRGIFQKHTLLFLFTSGFFGVIPWQVLIFWIFRYLETERQFNSVETTVVMMGVVLAMTLGYLVAGAVGDFAFRKTRRGRLYIEAFGHLSGFIFLILAMISPLENHTLFTIFLILGGFFMTLPAPQTPATIGDVVLPEVRSTAISIQYLIQNSGAALGPFIAGLIAVKTSLGTAMIISGCAWLVAMIFVLGASYHVPKDSAALRAQMEQRAQNQLSQ